MSRTAATLLVCATIAGAALWIRYDSLDPCDWIVPALAAKVGAPEIMLALALPTGTTLVDVRRALATKPRNECLRMWLHIQIDGVPGNENARHR